MGNCMIGCVVLLGIAGSAYSEAPKPAEQGNTSQEAGARGTDKILENNGKLDLDTAHWTVPKSWIRKTPKSMMLQAEYGIPKAACDKDDGRLTISRAGGSVDENIARWKGQFSKKLDKESQDHARRSHRYVRRLARHDGAARDPSRLPHVGRNLSNP